MNHTRWLSLILLCAVCVAGCSLFKSDKAKAAKPAPKAIVTPLAALSGRVASVNTAGQFVVITFEAGQLPAPDQKLNVYRAELKVGELKVSRQQIGRNVVADIVAGEARVGDEARAAEEAK